MHRRLPSLICAVKGSIEQFWQIQKVAHAKLTIFVLFQIFITSFNILNRTLVILYIILQEVSPRHQKIQLHPRLADLRLHFPGLSSWLHRSLLVQFGNASHVPSTTRHFLVFTWFGCAFYCNAISRIVLLYRSATNTTQALNPTVKQRRAFVCVFLHQTMKYTLAHCPIYRDRLG